LHSKPSFLQSAFVSQVPSGSHDELGAMPGKTFTGTAGDDRPSGAQKSRGELVILTAGVEAVDVVADLAMLGAVRVQPVVPLVAAMASMSQSPREVHSPAARLPAVQVWRWAKHMLRCRLQTWRSWCCVHVYAFLHLLQPFMLYSRHI
jgi:hypothetical protein